MLLEKCQKANSYHLTGEKAKQAQKVIEHLDKIDARIGKEPLPPK